MKLLFNQGKYAPLIRFLQGASDALGSISSTAAGQSSGTAAGAAAGSISAADAARKQAEQLLWGANRLSVTSWLVAALDQVEGQFRGVGLALLMERWVKWEAELANSTVCVLQLVLCKRTAPAAKIMLKFLRCTLHDTRRQNTHHAMHPGACTTHTPCWQDLVICNACGLLNHCCVCTNLALQVCIISTGSRPAGRTAAPPSPFNLQLQQQCQCAAGCPAACRTAAALHAQPCCGCWLPAWPGASVPAAQVS